MIYLRVWWHFLICRWNSEREVLDHYRPALLSNIEEGFRLLNRLNQKQQ